MHVYLHIAAALTATVLAVVILASRKGTPRHKALGRIAAALMALIAAHSFVVRELNDGALSGIHILSGFTLAALAYAVVQIRRGKVRAHKWAMTGVFSGFVIAGILTMLPGRFLHKALFSLF